MRKGIEMRKKTDEIYVDAFIALVEKRERELEEAEDDREILRKIWTGMVDALIDQRGKEEAEKFIRLAGKAIGDVGTEKVLRYVADFD
jgi:hypothetical protein